MPNRNLDPAPKIIRWETSEARDRCFYINNHTPCPDTYAAWHLWADRKSKTHEQVRCPGCGLFAIWRPTPTGDAAPKCDLPGCGDGSTGCWRCYPVPLPTPTGDAS